MSICSLNIHYQKRETPIRFMKSFATSYYIYFFNRKSKKTHYKPHFHVGMTLFET